MSATTQVPPLAALTAPESGNLPGLTWVADYSGQILQAEGTSLRLIRNRDDHTLADGETTIFTGNRYEALLHAATLVRDGLAGRTN